MPELMRESFLTGKIGYLNYRGLLRADLTDERFCIAFLWGNIVADVPIGQIKEVHEIRNVIEFGVRVIWQDGYARKEIKFRSSQRRKWINAFQRLGITTRSAGGWFDFRQ
jgi:hypothetical protein